ncbi:MAG: ester cyclase [Pseudomonadota bacterium]
MQNKGAYGAASHILDYILGITYEIWEEGGVDLIRQYYGDNCVVYAMDGLTRGAETVINQTRAMLEAFPDRRLLADNVVYGREPSGADYTSHRLISTMTHQGAGPLGPATGKAVRLMNIADCEVHDGVIKREWLVRDSLTLAQQLGLDPITQARRLRAGRTAEHGQWLSDEHDRVSAAAPPAAADETTTLAWQILTSHFAGDPEAFRASHAPYCVLHRSPLEQRSGWDAVFGHYEELRAQLGDVKVSVDHVVRHSWCDDGLDMAVRWTAAGHHQAPLQGEEPSGQPLLILGVSHFRCLAGRVITNHTVFDRLALLSQAVGDD